MKIKFRKTTKGEVMCIVGENPISIIGVGETQTKAIDDIEEQFNEIIEDARNQPWEKDLS
jgi:hypothetical protein